MNWDAAGAVGEILGAIGVIGSLLYLGIQIRRDQVATTANTIQLRATGARDIFLASATSDFLGSTLSRLNEDTLSPGTNALIEKYGLDTEEAWRVSNYYNCYMRQLEANLRTPMSVPETEQTEKLIAQSVKQGGPIGLWWDHAKPSFASDFADKIERLR